MRILLSQYHDKSGWSQKLPAWNSEQTLVLAFFSPQTAAQQPQWLVDLQKQFPQAKIIGCSTAGEIFGSQIDDNGVSVAVTQFDKTKIQLRSVHIQSAEDSFNAGKKLAASLLAPELKGVLVISEGLKVNGSALIGGINSVLPKDVVVTGGLAGDASRFQQTWTINEGKIADGYVTAVGFYGNSIHIGHGSQGGWDIFGPERMITRSKDNVLYELDGKPALDLYKEYLGERSKELPSSGLLFPLQIRASQQSDHHLVRTILAVNEQEKSLTFAGDMPEGWNAQLMKANFDRLIEGASTAAEQSSYVTQNPMLAISISCVGRRLILGNRAEEEVEATLEKLPAGTQQVGFYSYGELSPNSKLSNCELHNQTMTITTISEAA